jgi:hypothetical protein
MTRHANATAAIKTLIFFLRHHSPCWRDAELAEESRKDSSRGHLEYDSTNHNVFALKISLEEQQYSNRSHGASYGLDYKGNDVAGAENTEVERWTDWRCLTACVLYESAQDNINSCGEESRCNDESAYLKEESVEVRRTFCKLGSTSPSKQFSYWLLVHRTL